jgi:putative transposase
VFGYRFITDELAADHGITASENRVARLCSAHGIFWVLARRTGHRPKPGEPVHDDRVRRSFGARAPNELWFTDITEHPTAEGTLDLCAVKDAFSARIVGYSLDSRMKASLAVAALRNAIELRRPCGTIVHSDRGSQFRAGKFVRLLRGNGLVGSMGRKGACADDASMESFFALPQRKRPGPAALADAGGAAARDHRLDRADLPPPAPSAGPREAHSDRVRSNARGRS